MLSLLFAVIILYFMVERRRIRKRLIKLSDAIDETLTRENIPSVNFFRTERVIKRAGPIGLLNSVEMRFERLANGLASDIGFDAGGTAVVTDDER